MPLWCLCLPDEGYACTSHTGGATVGHLTLHLCIEICVRDLAFLEIQKIRVGLVGRRGCLPQYRRPSKTCLSLCECSRLTFYEPFDGRAVEQGHITVVQKTNLSEHQLRFGNLGPLPKYKGHLNCSRSLPTRKAEGIYL